MKIIFALSYACIPKALSAIERGSEAFLNVTNSSQVKRFFDLVTSEDEVVLLESDAVASRNPLTLFQNWVVIRFATKRVTGRLLASPSENIYFFILDFCEFEDLIVKRLSRSSTVYYRPAVNLDALRKRTSMRSSLNVIQRWFMFGIIFKPL